MLQEIKKYHTEDIKDMTLSVRKKREYKIDVKLSDEKLLENPNMRAEWKSTRHFTRENINPISKNHPFDTSEQVKYL